MKFGLWYAAVGPFAFPQHAVALAVAAEAAGFESMWTGDHIAVPAAYTSRYPYSDTGRMPSDTAIPMAEPLIWAAHLAAVTERMRFASGVLVAPQRGTVLLAKQVATLAVLSSNRFSLGVGAGWLREEFDLVGEDFASRGSRLDEQLEALRRLWTDEIATYHGSQVSFVGAQVAPRPSDGHVPIVVGGESAAAARRAGRFGDGYFPAKAAPEELPALVAQVHASATAAGRDPVGIEVTVHDPRVWETERRDDLVRQWSNLGVARILLSPNTFDPGALCANLLHFGNEVER